MAESDVPPPPRSSSFAWAGCLAIGGIGVLVAVAALLFLGGMTASRASNERNAGATLKTLATAEADFRANDRDNDGRNAFWVRDVYSLYALCPSPDGTGPEPAPLRDKAIKLIEISVAGADVTGLPLLPGVVPVDQVAGDWHPKSSYVFRALKSGVVGGMAQPYGEDGGISAHAGAGNPSRFGFMSLPATGGGAPRRFFLVNEDNTIWTAELGPTYAPVYRGGPGPGPASITWTGAVVGGAAFTPASPFPEAPTSSGWKKYD